MRKSGLPREFKLFLEAAKGLEFTETPKYDYFRQLLYDLYQRVPGGGGDMDYIYDWTPQPAPAVLAQVAAPASAQLAEEIGEEDALYERGG